MSTLKKARQKVAADTPAPIPAAEPWEPPIPFDQWPTPPFPLETLPPWLSQFVAAVAESTQTPPDLAAMLALAVCGAGVARRWRIAARPGWTEPLNLYCLTVLPSGERKSAVLSQIMTPVWALERERIQAAAPRVAESESAKRQLEARLRNAETHAAKAADDNDRLEHQLRAKELARELAQFQLIRPPQLVSDDITPEKLAQLLSIHDGRMLIASAEGNVFEVALGRYTDSGPNLEVFLKAHSGDPIRVDRLGREANVIESPALTMAMAVQPSVLATVAEQKKSTDLGFLARFLFSLPRSKIGARKIAPPGVPPMIAAAYEERIRQLWELPGVAVDDMTAPALLELHPAADRHLREFEAMIEPRLDPEAGDLTMMREWATKLAGAALRLAGILHLAANVGRANIPHTVSEKSMLAALALANDYCLPHAQAAFGMMGADPEINLADKVLTLLPKIINTLPYGQNGQNGQNPLDTSANPLKTGQNRKPGSLGQNPLSLDKIGQNANLASQSPNFVQDFAENGNFVQGAANSKKGPVSSQKLPSDPIFVHFVHFVLRGTPVKKRDIYRAMRGTFKRVESLDPILLLLERHAYLRSHNPDQPARAGRPSEAYLINPLWRPWEDKR